MLTLSVRKELDARAKILLLDGMKLGILGTLMMELLVTIPIVAVVA